MLCGALIACATAFLAPGDFTTRIDNPYMPMRPGSRWVYRETEAGGTAQRVVVKVTRRTKRIANGITARVVRDTVTERGRLVEDTFDWFAQDRAGNVWYLGEDTTEYEDGQAEVAAGHFQDVLTTRDWNPVEPRVLEYKLYARGVGLVLAVQVSGGSGRAELLRYEPGGRPRRASSSSKRASGLSSSSPSSSRSRASR
jgi:hypothetical protein